jgi:hypothetical protein
MGTSTPTSAKASCGIRRRWRFRTYLEDDGEIFGGLGGIDGNTDEGRSLIADLNAKLGTAQSVRLFGARSAAAFWDIINRGDWDDILEDAIAERHFLTKEHLMGRVFARGERTARTFDEGNRPSVAAIVDLKAAIRQRLVGGGHLIIPDGTRPARSKVRQRTFRYYRPPILPAVTPAICI